MAEQANAPLRVMTSESSWRSRRSYVGKANQVRHARAFLARVLEGFPLVDDAVLLISELCANVVQHSSSGNPGGMFTVHAEVHEGQYVWAEVGDCGGLWTIKDDRDGRGHGLGIVREIAADWGRDGDQRWITVTHGHATSALTCQRPGQDDLVLDLLSSGSQVRVLPGALNRQPAQAQVRERFPVLGS